MTDAAVATNPSVTLKPEAIEAEKFKDEKPEDRMKRLNLSAIPYHTYETEQIAKAAAAKAPKDVPYKYEANGYTVEEREYKTAKDAGLPKDTEEFVPYTRYVVTADGFEKGFETKQAAEMYARTHAESHKDMPADVSKA